MEADHLILLVEDDEDDAFLFQRALEQLGYTGRLQHVRKVEEAQTYLLGEKPFSGRREFPLPELIVADSAIEGATAAHLWEWIKNHQASQNIPFVVLSGDVSDLDRKRWRAQGVQWVFEKPGDPAEALSQMKSILQQAPSQRSAD